MNKTTITLVSFALLAILGMFGSCGNANKQSQEMDTFKTADLILCELQGHVKEVIATTFNTDKDFNKIEDESSTPIKFAYAYTKDGKIAIFESIDFTQVVNDMKSVYARNNNGEIMRIDSKSNLNYDERNYYYIYEWDNGLPSEKQYSGWEWGSTTKFSYGENNLCTKAIEIFTEYESIIETEYNYEYTEFDSNNNWIKRKNTMNIVTKEEDSFTGQSSIVSKEQKYSITERIIIYY